MISISHRANLSDGARGGRGYLGGGTSVGCSTKAFTRQRDSAGKGRVAADTLGSPLPGQGGFSQRRNPTCALTDQMCQNSSTKVVSGCAHQDWAAKAGLLPALGILLTAPCAQGSPWLTNNRF